MVCEAIIAKKKIRDWEYWEHLSTTDCKLNILNYRQLPLPWILFPATQPVYI